MSEAARHDSVRARAVDRLRELASIGAGHACGALATLLGRPFVMGVPEARIVSAGSAGAPFDTPSLGDERADCGVLFEVSGGPAGALALLFAPSARAALLERLLGKDAAVTSHAESALREVGNIVASHALSAIGELTGSAVLPSPPHFVAAGAAAEFARRLAERAAGEPVLQIAVELSDRAGEVRALLVWAPEALG